MDDLDELFNFGIVLNWYRLRDWKVLGTCQLIK